MNPRHEMRGILLENGSLSYHDDLPTPEPGPDETLVRVVRAGVCATDLALARGYMGFRGIPGHEFVGVAEDGALRGRRVVGEINAACGTCDACVAGLDRHCSQRSVLGILGRSGAFAEYLTLPTRNLLPVPDTVSTDAATFTEPLAAAFEMQEQLDLARYRRAVVAGDGKLGLLCAHVLHLGGLQVTVAGRHGERRELLPPGVHHLTGLLESDRSPDVARFDLAVEATGNPDVLPRLLGCVRPRGTVVLKTTTERPVTLDLAPVVVDEITLVGSRCGRFAPALDALAAGQVDVERLVAARYALGDGAAAVAHAARPGVLKVLLDCE